MEYKETKTERTTRYQRSILAAMPGTHSEISRLTGIDRDIVHRWLKKFEKDGRAHIGKLLKPHPHGGKPMNLWRAGPKPANLVVQPPKRTKHAMDVARWRASKGLGIPVQRPNNWSPLAAAMSGFGAAA